MAIPKKKKQFKTISTILMTLVVPVVLIIVLLLTIPKLRHGVFLFSQELVGYATNFMLQQYVPIKRFDKAIPWLERELSLVNWFAPPRNRLLPNLIQNTKYVVERARYPEEFAVLQPFLKKFVDSHPKLYPARLWLARALSKVDSSETFKQLEIATKLSSADDRPFRIAINLALKNRLPEKLKEWCELYQSSHFGGLVPLIPSLIQASPVLSGVGLRQLALEVVSDSGKRQVSRNNGLRLEENVTYDFHFEKNVPIKELNLHLPIVSGISVALKKIQLYSNGQRKLSLEKDLILSSWSGFHLEDGRVLTVSNSNSKDAEIIFIRPPKGRFGEADRIELTISFERLGLANSPVCQVKKKK
jgi:hypothetical protein